MVKTTDGTAWHGDVMIILEADSYVHCAHSCFTHDGCFNFNWVQLTGRCEIIIGRPLAITPTEGMQSFHWVP